LFVIVDPVAAQTLTEPKITNPEDGLFPDKIVFYKTVVPTELDTIKLVFHAIIESSIIPYEFPPKISGPLIVKVPKLIGGCYLSPC
jgi:hypothetical protein